MKRWLLLVLIVIVQSPAASAPPQSTSRADFQSMEEGAVELGPVGRRRSTRRRQPDYTSQAPPGGGPGQRGIIWSRWRVNNTEKAIDNPEPYNTGC